MKQLLAIILLAVYVLPGLAHGYGIVNNSGATGQDSMAVPFYLLDSTGSGPVALASGDSVFVAFFYPNGDFAFADSGAYNDAQISSKAMSSYTTYTWQFAVADVDGASATNGVYTYILVAKDATSAALGNPYRGSFQLYQDYDFSTWATRLIDTSQGIKDLLDNRETWTLAGRDRIGDTIQRAASTLTEDSHIGIDWSDVANPTTSVNLSATNIANVTGNVGGVLSIATNAITSGVLAGTAITEVLDSLFNTATRNWDTANFSAAFQAHLNYLDEAISGIDDNPWDAGTRTLTALGFDLDTTDLAPALQELIILAGDTSLQATPDDFWMNIDTTNVDSSDIGDWFRNNIAGGGGGSDTTLIKAMMVGNSFAQTGTDQVWELRGLYVTAGGTDSSAAVFTGNGAGEGLDAVGGANGHGFRATGYGTANAGIYAVGGGTGLYAAGTSYNGIWANGGTTGFLSTGTTANGAEFWGGTMDVRLDNTGSIESATDRVAMLGDSAAFQGSASGLDSGTVAGAVVDALQGGTIDAHLTGLKIIGNDADSGLFYVNNAGGRGVELVGTTNALYAYSSDNATVRLSNASSYPTFWIAQSGTGEAFKAEITSTTNTNQVFEIEHDGNGAGLWVRANDTSAAVQIYNYGTGEGLNIVAEANDALQLQIGAGATAGTYYGMEIEGGVYWHGRQGEDEDAFRLHSSGTGLPFYLWPDSSYRPGMRISGDSGLFVPAGIVPEIGTDTSQIKTVATNNPNLFYGPTASGSGANEWNIVVLDTTGGVTVGAVSRAKVSIYDMAASLDGQVYTNSSGVSTFTVDLDSFTVVVTKAGTGMQQSSPNDTLIVAANGQTDTVYVTFISYSQPPYLSSVFLYYYDHGYPTDGARLVIRNENVVYDSTQGLVMGPILQYDVTDTTGLASVVVPKSYLFSDSLQSLYDIGLTYRGRIVKTWSDVYIPDQDTLRLTLGE